MRLTSLMTLWWLGLLGGALETLASMATDPRDDRGLVGERAGGRGVGADPGDTLRGFRPPMALHFQEDEETGERDSPGSHWRQESLSTPAAEAAEAGNLHDELAEIFNNEKHSPGYEHIEHVQRQLAGQSCSDRQSWRWDWRINRYTGRNTRIGYRLFYLCPTYTAC